MLQLLLQGFEKELDVASRDGPAEVVCSVVVSDTDKVVVVVKPVRVEDVKLVSSTGVEAETVVELSVVGMSSAVVVELVTG